MEQRESLESSSMEDDARVYFAELVNSVGVKRFAQGIGVTSRQINRMLSGAQPNPLSRMIRCLQAGDATMGDRILDYVCQEMGGHFVRQESIDDATINAVKECAEAIAAISDGQISDVDVRQIREAISALSGLIGALRGLRPGQSPD